MEKEEKLTAETTQPEEVATVAAEEAPATEAPVTEAPAAEQAPVDPQARITELEEYKRRNEEYNQKIMDALDMEPLLAKFIQDITAGATLREVISRYFDPEDLTAQEGDPDYEAMSRNRETRVKERDERKKWGEELAANHEMSKKEIVAFAEEMQKSPEEMIDFMGKVDEMYSNIVKGLIDRKTLGFLWKAVIHDQAVIEAREEGEVAGKNANIVTKKVSAREGDGIPKVTAADAPVTDPPPAPKKGYMERLMEK